MPRPNSKLNGNSWQRALLASAALWLTVCLFGPLFLEFTYSPVIDASAYILTLLFVSLALTALTSFALVKLVPRKYFPMATLLVLMLGVVIYARVFILNNIADLLNQVSSVDLTRYSTVIVGLLFLACIFIAFLLRRSLCRHVGILSVAFLTYQVLFLLMWIHFGGVPNNSHGRRLVNDYANSFSKTKNILLLVLDSYDADDFKIVLNGNKKLSECLQGFTFFPDSVGGYDDTQAAVPHILTGLFHDCSIPTSEFLEAKLPLESIPGILKLASFRTEAYGEGAHRALHALVIDNATTKKRVFLEPSEILRIILQFVLRCAPHQARKYLINFYISLSEGTPTAVDFLGSAYDIVKINELEKHASADTVQPVFKYEHFWGAHGPYILSENIQVRQKSLTLKARIDQSTAAMKLCCKYLAVLKNIEAYNGSMIFIVGDHCHRDRASFPLMMWKPFNDSQPFRISSKPVAQTDIIKTICDELGLPLTRSYAESLRHEDSTRIRIRRYMPYSLRDGREQIGYVPELLEFMFRGTRYDVENAVPSLKLYSPGLSASIPKLHNGSKLVFTKGGEYRFYTSATGWNVPQSNLLWNRGPVCGFFLPIRDAGQPLRISIKCRPFLSYPNLLAQSLRIVGGNGLLLFEGKLNGPSTIEFAIPKEAFDGDLLPLFFHFPDLDRQGNVEETVLSDGAALGFESLSITN